MTDTDHPQGELEQDRHFGEQGARLTYGSYLRVAELLDQQRLESDPPAHDELLFITIHQVYELWFKQLLHELDAPRARRCSRATCGGPGTCCAGCVAIEDVLIRQIAVLETMTPQDFLVFRDRLAPASGFQSVQFRELEFLSGAKDPGFLERFRGLTDAETGPAAAPARRADAVGRLPATSYAGPGCRRGRRRGGARVAADRRRATASTYGEVWELAERLLDHDENAALWRSRHVLMVERQIGTKSGTGGSSGSPYLRSRLGLHYFPLLWELRRTCEDAAPERRR